MRVVFAWVVWVFSIHTTSAYVHLYSVGFREYGGAIRVCDVFSPGPR